MAAIESLAASVRCWACKGPVELIRVPLAGPAQYKFRCLRADCPWESLPQRRVQLKRHGQMVRQAYEIAARHQRAPQQARLWWAN